MIVNNVLSICNHKRYRFPKYTKRRFMPKSILSIYFDELEILGMNGSRLNPKGTFIKMMFSFHSLFIIYLLKWSLVPL